MQITLDPAIYSEKKILQAIKDYEELATITYKNGILQIVSVLDDEVDAQMVAQEFGNYLIALHV